MRKLRAYFEILCLSLAFSWSAAGHAQRRPTDLDEFIVIKDPDKCEFNTDFEAVLDGLAATKNEKPMPRVSVPPEYAERFGDPELSPFDGGGGWIIVPMTGNWKSMALAGIHIWENRSEPNSWAMSFALKPSELRKIMTYTGFNFDQVFDNGQAWANFEHSYIGIAPDHENPGITMLTCAVLR
jgi:hypothetical protein